MSDCVRYPAPGCVVEYLEGNAVQIALITEEAGGRLRLLLPNRRETRLNAPRLLPWLGPMYSADLGKEDAVRLLEQHRKSREQLAAEVPVMDAWELAQGEVALAPAQWFAELFATDPDSDQVAAYGRALLACKSHFRFQPPDFQVFPEEMVEKRLVEEKARLEREALMAGGAAFLRMLWDVAC
ncbi:ribonuclease II, partial [Desulfovibrio sp. 1214_IL3152]